MLLPVAVAVNAVDWPNAVGLELIALRFVIDASVMVTNVVAIAVLIELVAVTRAVYVPIDP